MLSIITVMNNKKIFIEWLKKGLALQEDIKYELIVVNNKDNRYKSLGEAYTSGVEKATGEWLMFVHPDVCFLNNNTLKGFYDNIEKIEKSNNNIRLWGVAGVEEGSFQPKNFITSIVHGEDAEKNIDNFNGREYVIVQTVDACCFTIRKELFDKYGFSKKLSGFHMFVEEFCIRIKKDGFDSAVIPIDLWHRSKGDSLDYTYFLAVFKLLRFYPDLKSFNTTTIQGNINIYYIAKLVYYEIKYLLKHLLKHITFN